MAAAIKDVEMPVTVRKLSIAAEEVREAIEIEHSLGFWETVKLYPRAIGWSCYFSLGVIMLGITTKSRPPSHSQADHRNSI